MEGAAHSRVARQAGWDGPVLLEVVFAGGEGTGATRGIPEHRGPGWGPGVKVRVELQVLFLAGGRRAPTAAARARCPLGLGSPSPALGRHPPPTQVLSCDDLGGAREPSGEGGGLRASTYPARRRHGAQGPLPGRGFPPAPRPHLGVGPGLGPQGQLRAWAAQRPHPQPAQRRLLALSSPGWGPKLPEPRAGRRRQNSPCCPPTAPEELLGGAPDSGVSPPPVTCGSGCQAGPLDSFIATSNFSFTLHWGSCPLLLEKEAAPAPKGNARVTQGMGLSALGARPGARS